MSSVTRISQAMVKRECAWICKKYQRNGKKLIKEVKRDVLVADLVLFVLVLVLVAVLAFRAVMRALDIRA